MPPNDALFDVLRSERDALNAAFSAARRQFPALTEEAFKGYLLERVAPLARAASDRTKDRVAEVVLGAYEVGLELVGQNLAGPGARHPYVNQAFESVFPACIAHVSREPLRVLAALSNAVHQLASTAGARPDQWLIELARAGPHASGVDELMQLGQVLAWRAGLAHFRAGALAACARLPERLSRLALGAIDAPDFSKLQERLTIDPWFDPAQPNRNPSARWVGGFRGFGGLFQQPPRVSESGGNLLVESGKSVWLLTADAFGATFHRATDIEIATRRSAELSSTLRYDDGTVHFRGRPLPLIGRGTPTSAAALAHTVAVTFASTHELALCALGETP